MREHSSFILADIIAAKAESKPDLDILTFEGGGVRNDEIRTYQSLWENGNRIAAGLIARGMAPGDRFALILRNHPEFVDAMVGTSISACVFVPIDPRTRGHKLAYTLNNSGCRGAIVADYAVHFLNQIRDSVPTLDWVWVLETDEETFMPWSDVKGAETLAAVYAEPYTTGHDRLTGPEDLFEIMYTSGTTGDPKGVVCRNGRYGMVAQPRQGGLAANDQRPYTGLSLTHGNAQMITLGMTIGGDTRSVFSRKFTKSRLWDITRKYGCTMFNLLGGMATAIYAEPERDDDGDNPVQFVLSAGMPIAIWEAFEKRFNVAIAEGYGAVEGGSSSKPIGVGPIGSIGRPPAQLEIRIVDEDDNDCPPGVPGELISRPRDGPRPKVEYWGDPEASEDKTRGGWLRSGDVCHLDDEGWLFFDFRKGGGIRRNGDFINPGFVEGVVAASDQVVDVFVYGVPASSGAPGEKDVVAAIVPVDRASFDSVAVFSKCRQDLEPNFVPSFLQLVAEIPKTASEKPQERFLLERFDAGTDEIFTE